MLRLRLALMFVIFSLCASAATTVTDVVAKQRYPWNGLVDISCKVSGINGTTNGLVFAMAAVMPDSGDVRKVSHFCVMQNGVKLTDRGVCTNGNYRLLWDAQAEFGAVIYSNMVMRVNVVELHHKVQLWEGGAYWADANIGAENPEDYGYYFWWGDTIGYKRKNNSWVASDGSSSNFLFALFDSSITPTYNKSISTLKSEGWITEDEVLAPEHDAAHVHWGGEWRMPTKQELSDLCNKCTWSLTTVNGVRGYRVSGNGDYSSNSIFLPCSGCGTTGSLSDAGSYGRYWSSVPYSDDNCYAWTLRFDSDSHTMAYYGYIRGVGQSVRPVQGFTK